LEDSFVEVLDIVVTTRMNLTHTHTFRPHEGDELFEHDGGFQIRFGPKKVLTADGVERVTRRTATIPADTISEMIRTTRWEPRVRLTIADILDRDKAEAARLAQKHGIQVPIS
jgi:hypothetical protein